MTMASNSNRAPRLKQGDLSRALKATSAAGLKASRIDIDPSGRIAIVLDNGQEILPPSELSPIDDELARALKAGR